MNERKRACSDGGKLGERSKKTKNTTEHVGVKRRLPMEQMMIASLESQKADVITDHVILQRLLEHHVAAVKEDNQASEPHQRTKNPWRFGICTEGR